MGSGLTTHHTIIGLFLFSSSDIYTDRIHHESWVAKMMDVGISRFLEVMGRHFAASFTILQFGC